MLLLCLPFVSTDLRPGGQSGVTGAPKFIARLRQSFRIELIKKWVYKTIKAVNHEFGMLTV